MIKLNTVRDKILAFINLKVNVILPPPLSLLYLRTV